MISHSNNQSHKVSAIQLTSAASVNENLFMVESLIKTAVSHGTRLVVLPEMMRTM